LRLKTNQIMPGYYSVLENVIIQMKKLRSGLNMEKSKNFQDKVRIEIIQEELKRVKYLVKGHHKLLTAIGNL